MWKPSQDRVVLKGVTPEKVTSGGLVIPLEAQKISQWEVIAIGPLSPKCEKCQDEIIKLEVGMLIMINDTAGMDIVVDGESQRVIRFSDIHLYNDEIPK